VEEHLGGSRSSGDTNELVFLRRLLTVLYFPFRAPPQKGFKKIPFLNTIKYIFVFKEGLNHGSWFRLKNAVLTDAWNIRSAQDGPGSTFLSDPLSLHPKKTSYKAKRRRSFGHEVRLPFDSIVTSDVIGKAFGRTPASDGQ
jgi:hypothetical protein